MLRSRYQHRGAAPSGSCSSDSGQEGPHSVERTEDVDVEYLAERFTRDRVDGSALTCPGVSTDEVNRAGLTANFGRSVSSAARSVTSARAPLARPPDLVIMPTVSDASLTSTARTSAHRLAASRARARPTPVAAPVTITMPPAIPLIEDSFFCEFNFFF